MRRLLVWSLLLHALIAWRLLPSLPFPGAVAMALLLTATFFLIPRALDFRRRHAPWLTWASLIALGLFSSLLVFTLLRELVLAGAWLAGVPGLAGPTALAVAAAAPFATLVGFWNARRTAAVRRIDVPIANLPPALAGFTIAQLSDVHVGPTIKGPYLAGIVDAVNRLAPDMVAITGDLVDGSVAELSRHTAPLAGLRSRHGTFFVTGNHEYYSGAHAWIRELRRLGLTVLLNEHVVIDHDGAPLVVAGVTDYSAHHFDGAHRSDPARALAGAPASAATKLLLAHQPRSAPAAAEAGFDLQLSGHTHGGQFWPWGHFVRFQQPFTAGLNRLHRLWVYVSRGTGYWGPPKRLGAPSEISLVRLVPA